MKKLPKVLYVRWEDPGNDEPWLMTGDTAAALLEDADDQKTVGVYELTKTVVAKSTVSVSVQTKTSSRKRSK